MKTRRSKPVPAARVDEGDLAGLEAAILAQETPVRKGRGARATRVHTKTAHYKRKGKHGNNWRDDT